jgi:Zn-dependent peptidase ImmA (M78 family)
MSFKIPEKIRVGGITYTVEYSDQLIRESRVGEIDYHDAVIRICKSTAPDVQSWTFFHELVHSMLMTLGYKGEDEIVLDERFVDSFASVLGCVVEELVR